MLIGAMPVSAGTLIVPVEILGGPRYQHLPYSNVAYLGWTQNTARNPGKFQPFVSDDGGATRTKLNEAGTTGFFGDIDTDSNEIIYQQVDAGASDLYFIGAASLVRTPADAINSNRWEWGAKLSDTHILFTRDLPAKDKRLLLLYDRVGGSTTLIQTYRWSRVDVWTGDVGSAYATWTTCNRSNCYAWWYDIAAVTKAKIPTLNDRPQYAPVIDEMHANAYWVRSGNACGVNVGIWKAPLASLGAPTKIADLDPAIDTDWRMSLEYDSVGGRIDLLFARYDCALEGSDLYELPGVDTIP
jgi:hypothetical protein